MRGLAPQPIDLLAVMYPALHALEDLHVPYYLGGSIASSLHGMQQLAQDIDLVVDLNDQTLPSLCAALGQHYLLEEDEAREAVREHKPFPLIHLDSLMKVDVVFPKREAFAPLMRPLIRGYTLDERYPPIQLASATEMILFKMRRYQRNEQSRTDGMQDDAEWNDVLGMLKVQGPDRDLALLLEWAGKLDVRDVAPSAGGCWAARGLSMTRRQEAGVSAGNCLNIPVLWQLGATIQSKRKSKEEVVDVTVS